MIIQIHGTSGSGKSHMVREAMRIIGGFEPLAGEKRPKGYFRNTAPRIFVVGSYETVCGGCDTIKTQDEICDRVRTSALFAQHVVFEGLLQSNIYARYSALADELGREKYLHAFLDTPLEMCFTRINERRAAKGKLDPVPPRQTTQKFNTIRKIHLRRGSEGYWTESVPWERSTQWLVGKLMGKMQLVL